MRSWTWRRRMGRRMARPSLSLRPLELQRSRPATRRRLRRPMTSGAMCAALGRTRCRLRRLRQTTSARAPAAAASAWRAPRGAPPTLTVPRSSCAQSARPRSMATPSSSSGRATRSAVGSPRAVWRCARPRRCGRCGRRMSRARRRAQSSSSLSAAQTAASLGSRSWGTASWSNLRRKQRSSGAMVDDAGFTQQASCSSSSSCSSSPSFTGSALGAHFEGRWRAGGCRRAYVHGSRSCRCRRDPSRATEFGTSAPPQQRSLVLLRAHRCCTISSHRHGIGL
mmetsp:Transcript_24577/g.70122  ORF Transcript_24577/g.70122 Transcript_24577/m.70122 type:complete len:281 (+) Transcript_24577:534-1376(+)